MKKIILLLILTMLYGWQLGAQELITIGNMPYRDAPADEYQAERCVLDLRYPADSSGYVTVVWFHGGGLTGGNKHIPAALEQAGLAVAAVNYRLSPRVNAPAYFDDAAAAVAWVTANIESYGGDPSRIYVAGHSAGGYLASMLALDKSLLAAYGYDADRIKGWVPVSGQAATHWQVCRERGDSSSVPVVDRYAPLSHVRSDTPPILLTAGQAELEMVNRTAENRYLYDALRTVGNNRVVFHELSGFDHNTVVGPSLQLLLEMIRRDARANGGK
ncbi:MAG: alpha/beta hydrolase fold domain-containing protein [Alistipes sp.]|nr:alpha/beta hydrolase fold domain-containing protein [Alistipes sp.]